MLKKWGGLYGGAIGVIQIKGQDLSTPLDLDTIDKGQFQGIVVYDRWQLNPVLTDCIQDGPETGLPSSYQIVNNPTMVDPEAEPATGLDHIHHSRVIRNVGFDLPYLQAITEMMWGESKLERFFDRLISFDNATMSCASLVDRANLRMVGVNGLREIIAAGGEALAGLVQMFEMVREMQVNEGITLIDKEDSYEASSYTFAGLSDMMLQFAQQLSGASGQPLIRLFCQSPAGLNATGDNDLRMYYDNINSMQEAEFRQGLEIILKVMWRSELGKEAPEDMEFTFVPLWQQTPTDKATNAKTITDTIMAAQEITGTATALTELREKSGDTGLFGSISDEQIADAKDQDENPPMPGEVDAPEKGRPEVESGEGSSPSSGTEIPPTKSEETETAATPPPQKTKSRRCRSSNSVSKDQQMARRKITDAKTRTIRGKFKASTAAERAFYKALKKVAQNSGHIVDAHVEGTKLVGEAELNKALKSYADLITPWARRQSAKLLDQVQKSNKRAYQNKSKAIGLALDLDVAQSEVGAVALRLLNEQVELIRSIPLEAGLRAQKIAYEAALHGTRAEPNQDTINELQKQLGLSTEVAVSMGTIDCGY